MVSTGDRRLHRFLALAAGVLIGIVGYLVMPLPIGSNAEAPSGPPSRSDTTAGSVSSAGESPPFTRSALLQPDELKGFGWGKADQTAIYDGVATDLPSLCAAEPALEKGTEESYSAEYRGVQTHAVEIVLRHRDDDAAAKAFDRVSDKTAACASAEKDRRGKPTRRHDPKLDEVDQARWWQIEVPAGSAGRDEPSRGVLAVARIDDRVVLMTLTSPTTDPSTTVQFEELLTQAARRLV